MIQTGDPAVSEESTKEASIVDVSIAIVNWNTCTLLGQCLDAARRCIKAETGIEVETIVVDNGSNDGSVEMVKEKYRWIRLIENQRNLGFARANNLAIESSLGRYVLLLNSDVFLEPSALRHMVRHLDKCSDTAIVSVCLAFIDGSPQFCYGDFPTVGREFRSLFGMHRWDLSIWGMLATPLEVDWVSGACMMVRRQLFAQIGLLDERFFFFGEEVDLCYRARQAGWKVYLLPGKPVVHVRAGSSGQTCERMLRLYRGKLRYSEKYFSKTQYLLVKIIIWTSTLSKLFVAGLLGLFRPDTRSKYRLWVDVAMTMVKKGL